MARKTSLFNQTIKRAINKIVEDIEFNAVSSLVSKSKNAQAIIEQYSQDKIDEIVLGVAWAVLKPECNSSLSELAVKTTGIGNVKDKITKNSRKTIGLLRDLSSVKTVGIISHSDKTGITEIARPVGVIGAITPSTNPVATPLNKIINALKCRNAIIVSPSPKGGKVCFEVLALIHTVLEKMAVPIDIVQMLPLPITYGLTEALVRQVDLVVATGTQTNILKAQQTGVPTFGVGLGNVPVIIDEEVVVDEVAKKICASKTFDYATSCSSENSLVIHQNIYQEMMAALAKVGGVVLNADEASKLQSIMWNDQLKLNPKIIAQSAEKIAELAGLDSTGKKFKGAQILIVETADIGNSNPFSREKLSPVLAVYRGCDFNELISITQKLLDYQGKGHSCGIHSNNNDHIQTLGEVIPVCRVIVNQAHCFATGGNFNNGMPFSLSMGCGSWGKNVIADNMNYRHYLNITKIIKTIKENEPTLEDLFAKYWAKYGSK